MKNDPEQILLSVIVPIGNMAGHLQFVESWLKQVKKYSLEVILALKYSIYIDYYWH